MENGLEVWQLLHHGLVRIGLRPVKDDLDLTNEVVHNPGVSQQRVKLPGQCLSGCISPSAIEISTSVVSVIAQDKSLLPNTKQDGANLHHKVDKHIAEFQICQL